MPASIVSQPTGLLPSNSDCGFCFEFSITDPNLQANGLNGVVAYRVLIDGCLVGKGSVISKYEQDVCAISPTLKYSLDITGIISNWFDLKTNPPLKKFADTTTDVVFYQPKHTANVVVEYAQCVNGVEDAFAQAPAFRVMFASCGCEDDLREIVSLADYDGPTKVTAYKPLLAPDIDANETICFDVNVLNKIQSGEYKYSGHNFCFHVDPTWASPVFRLIVNGQTANSLPLSAMTNTGGETICVDAYMFLFLTWGFSGGNPDPTVANISIVDTATGNESEIQTVKIMPQGCCTDEVVQFFNCLGQYQAMRLTREAERGFEVDRETYVGCKDCGSTSTQLNVIKQNYRRKHTYYTEPMRATKANLALLEAFLTSANYWLPRHGIEVYVDAKRTAVELYDGRLQVEVDLYTSKKIPVLPNKLS